MINTDVITFGRGEIAIGVGKITIDDDSSVSIQITPCEKAPIGTPVSADPHPLGPVLYLAFENIAGLEALQDALNYARNMMMEKQDETQ